MNRARALLVSLGLANSFFSTHLCTTNRQLSSQVTKFSSLFLSHSNHQYTSHLVNSHQNLLVSSSNFPSNSVSELVWAYEWSTKFEPRMDPWNTSDFFNWECEKNGFRPNSSIYVLALPTLARKESMVSFWIVLTKMKVEGFYIDKEMYLGILAQLERKNLASEVVALSNFYNSMFQETAMDGTVKKVIKIVLGSKWNKIVEKQEKLKELRNHPSKSMNFFKWVGQFPGSDHNSVTSNAIAWSLGRFMMDGPFKPSIQDCCRPLRVISASYNPDFELAFRVVMAYESAGYTLSKDVYDWIHRCLTGAGRFDKAEKIVNLMKTAGYKPDNITYRQRIYGLCKARRLEEACKVLVEMEGNGCVPDFKTWSILIRGHCVAGELDNALIYAYKLLINIVDITSLKLLQVTYTNLIEKLLMVRKLKEALNLLCLMQKQGYQPCLDPFAQYILKFGTAEDAAESLKGFPSFSAYVHALKSFFPEGRYY
ncbi:hypothetical protein UlMin_041956 [Ulmus minor]